MRTALFGGQQSEQFLRLLLELSNGKRALDLEGKVDMRPIGTDVDSVRELMFMVFADIQIDYKICFVKEPFLNTQKHTTVNDKNAHLLSCSPGNSQICKSIDSVPDQSAAVNYQRNF